MMTPENSNLIIPASQLIYANVEEGESPRRVRGFQPLFWTHDQLDEVEIKSEMIPRLVLLKRAKPESETVYFQMSQGRFAIGRVTPDTSSDIFGRSRVMFAHAIVLDKDSMRRVDFNPLRIIDRFSFYVRLEDVRTDIGATHGDIPATSIEFPSTESHTTVGWRKSPPDFNTIKQLLKIANRADRAGANRVLLGCLGSPSEILDFLRPLYELIPLPLRKNCTFDTLFAGAGKTKGNEFLSWAVGLAPGCGFADARCSSIDVRTGRFLGQPRISDEATLFEQWLTRLPPSAFGESFASQITWAYEMAATIDGAVSTYGFTDADDFVGEFLDSVRDLLENRMRQQLAARKVGSALAARLLKHAWYDIRSLGPNAINALARTIDIHRIAEWLCVAYLEPSSIRPSDEELTELAPIVEEQNKTNQHLVLLDAIYSFWNSDWYRLAKAVEWLDEQTYATFAAWALHKVGLTPEWKVTIDSLENLFFGPAIPSNSAGGRGVPLVCALLGGEISEIEEVGAPKTKGTPRTRSVFKSITGGMQQRWELLGRLMSPPVPDLPEQVADKSNDAVRQEIQRKFVKADDWRRSDWKGLARNLVLLCSEQYRELASALLCQTSMRIEWQVPVNSTGELCFGRVVLAVGTNEHERLLVATLLGFADYDSHRLNMSAVKHLWPALCQVFAEYGT